MLPLTLAARYKGRDGEPIHCPYPGLAALGAFFRRSQVSMVTAPPGIGKTAFVTDYVIALGEFGERVMYFSADSDKGTVANRVAANVTGLPLPHIEDMFKTNAGDLWQRMDGATRHIGYCFDSNPTYDVIKSQLYCYAWAHGVWPDVIVIDNLIDVQGDSDIVTDGYKAMADTAAWLKGIAAETHAAVIILHHSTGGFADGKDPLPASAVLGKIDKPQRLILTLHKPNDNQIGVSVVKNSNGPADTSGYGVMTLIDVDLERMFFSHR